MNKTRKYIVEPFIERGGFQIVALGVHDGSRKVMATLHNSSQEEADRQAAYMQSRYDQIRDIPIS